MLEWIIIGGGVQGVTLALHLLKSKKVTIDKLAIIDRNAEPLVNWKQNTKKISMPFLRSPFVHHLDEDPYSLQTYVKKHAYTKQTVFYGPYKRPSLSLFNEHCDFLVKEMSLKDAWVKGDVSKVMKSRDGWQVELKDGQKVLSKKVVIAIGVGEQLNIPSWASPLIKQSQNIFHIFNKTLLNTEQLERDIAIVGGGITAAHLAIKLSQLFPKHVTLLMRHPFRVHDFDSDPGWLGPKKQNAYQKLDSYLHRRNEITTARNKGSVPREIYMKLKALEKRESLSIKDIEISQGERENNKLLLLDKDNELIVKAGTVLLATGFLLALPGREWIEPMVNSYKLPTSECGYPIVNHDLQWDKDLYVTGALAELEIGPIARNISGARQAAERIINCL